MLHESYSFALSFDGSLVQRIIDRLSLDHKSVVLDPFCGTGTTLLECKTLGIPSVGIDANPVCVMVSRAKTDWSVDTSVIERLGKQALASALRNYRSFLSRQEAAGGRRQPQCDRIFSRSPAGRYLIASGLIERDWISPLGAIKTLLIVEQLQKLPSRPGNFLYLTLLGLLVPEISNMCYGPEIYRTRHRVDPDVFGLFRSRVGENLQMLRTLQSLYPGGRATVRLGDSVNGGLGFIEKESVRAVLSSPPYLSDHDYTRMTRLELVFAGYVSGSRGAAEDQEEVSQVVLKERLQGG